MIGDIIYVDREPLLWKSTKNRRNPNSKKLDIAIYRMTKYTHYGVDLGDGLVAHFQADSFWQRSESTIMLTTMDEFAKDGEVKVRDDIHYSFSREEVVDRAYEALDTNFGGYSIMDNNCEHFALWCATGSRESDQYWLLKQGYKSVSRPVAPVSRRMGTLVATGMNYSKALVDVIIK